MFEITSAHFHYTQQFGTFLVVKQFINTRDSSGDVDVIFRFHLDKVVFVLISYPIVGFRARSL